MAGLDRTREFFSAGGVILSGRGRPLSRMIAGLGLAAAVTVIAVPDDGRKARHEASRSSAELHAVDMKADAAGKETLPTGVEGRPTLLPTAEDALSLLVYHARRAASVLHIHQFGEFRVPQYVAGEIVRAANDTGFPSETLMAIAEKESSFDVDARPRQGTALGLMQFLEQKWLEVVSDYGGEFGLSSEAASIKTRAEGKGIEYYVEDPREQERILELRRVPYLSAALAAKNLIAAKKRIEARLDKAMSDADLYLPHFLGTNGAGNLLAKSEEKPGALARKVFPKAARYNAAMFIGKAGKPLTVRQFHDRTRSVIEGRVGKYRNVEEQVERAAYVPETPAGSGGIADLVTSGYDAGLLRR